MEILFRYRIDHVLFWLATISFHAYNRSYIIDKLSWGDFVGELLVRNLLLAGVIYGNLWILIPRLFNAKRYGGYFLSLAGLVLAYVLFKNLHDMYLYGYVLGDTERQTLWVNTFYNVSIAVFYAIFSMAIWLSREWFYQRELVQKIRNEQLATELQYLKSQMNPHVVFNTLNLIYGSIHKTNPIARQLVVQFSDLLRYQLYECNAEKVGIEKEIEYLQNYINLQRLRKNDNLKVEVNFHQDIQGILIAPLLFSPFVENAFKFVSDHVSALNVIDIQMFTEEGALVFLCKNTKNEKQMKPKSSSSGIGIANVKRRLELLYPRCYQLEIRETNELFDVFLKINLKSSL
ncbi:histidine kinase [Runella sp. MFBS21]|uniref:sensor histidine kinase n=1 Tax=Runella sp. MFBS21 TaxID=3034018 RepID=UPI0023F95A44|nr:histidine kinase [Runella sp. MFBS21]MDF7820653.1 histidine kinase [Runella sp. MFBS21]